MQNNLIILLEKLIVYIYTWLIIYIPYGTDKPAFLTMEACLSWSLLDIPIHEQYNETICENVTCRLW